jgi:hypothetical protein
VSEINAKIKQGQYDAEASVGGYGEGLNFSFPVPTGGTGGASHESDFMISLA